MSGKAPLPSLTGHRLKTRKRDEKKAYDPAGFRDAILDGLSNASNDLEAVTKFLEASSSKLDYRRYGFALIEVLIAGGLLAPGGAIVDDVKTDVCLFGAKDGACADMDHVRAWEQVFLKLVRR